MKPQPYPLTDGTVRYKVRFRVPGMKNPTSEVFSALDEAQKFIRLIGKIGPVAAREIRHASDASDLAVPTLASYLDTHLERLAASATPGTVADYRRMATRTWLVKLGDLPLDAITRDAVTRWVAWQRRQETRVSKATRARAAKAHTKDETVAIPEPVTYSTKSIANAQRLLSTVLGAAVEDEHIVRNVARGIPLPSDQAGAEKVFLSESEFTKLYDAVAEHYKPLVAFLAGTGARWGEATALQPGDFDLDADQPVVRIWQAWKKGAEGVYLGTPKTARGRRTVTLPTSVVTAVRDVVERAPEGKLVFSAAEGGRIQAQHFHPRVWRRAIEASGIGKRPRVHDLRHSHASWLIARGVPLTVIQRRLGHESIQTTSDTYGHLSPDAYAGAADAADIALAGALPQIEG